MLCSAGQSHSTVVAELPTASTILQVSYPRRYHDYVTKVMWTGKFVSGGLTELHVQGVRKERCGTDPRVTQESSCEEVALCPGNNI